MDLTTSGSSDKAAGTGPESQGATPPLAKGTTGREPLVGTEVPLPPARDGGSGSKLLGEFVRRLRGSRSLQAIEDLSKSPPLLGRIRPVDVSTLSKIETGKQFPSLTTLLSLEQLYEVPIQRFLDHVKLERYWDLRPSAGDYDAAMANGTKAGEQGDFPKSFAAFLLAESLSRSDEERAVATNCKAGMLWKMGMLQEAVNEFSDLLGDLSLSVALQVRALTNLASVYHSRGNLFEARLHAQEGLRMAEELGIVRSQAFLHRIMGTILDDLQERSARPDDRHLRDALRHYEKSSRLFEEIDLPAEMALNKVNAGSIYCRLGNFIVGLKSLRDGLAESEKLGNRRCVAYALKELGRAYFLTRNYQKAKDNLFDCERISERQGYLDLLYICYYYLREIEFANGGRGMHETKRLLRLRALQEGTFYELQQFEKQVGPLAEGLA